MLKIKTVKYKIRFLEDVVFKDEPEIAFLKAIYKRLKNILCINKNSRCSDCTYSGKCLYNYMSAGDFEFIENMPVIINKPLLSGRNKKSGDVIDLKFTFLGDAAVHIDFLNYAVKEFETRGLFGEKYRFFIESRTDNEIEDKKDNSNVSSIKILTPIDRCENIFKIEKEKIDNLNKLYRITDKPIDLITEPYEFDAVRFKMQKPLYIGNKKLIRKGYVGTIKFREPIVNNNLLKIINLIGAGKFYAIGGGCIEI
ncbi:MAG TPA: hypothetical protein GXZ31_08810 [Thermoanaerobacterales bacterium]|nr:hypothetical protein [Thermoanaerobacterales bacterium]